VTPTGLVLLGDGEAVRLVGSASSMWDLLVDPIAADALVSRLAEAYGEDAAVIRGDVLEALDSLSAAGLVISES
jgi:hypothetical protein